MEHSYTAKYENIILRPLGQDDIQALRVWRNNTKENKFLRDVGYITEEMQVHWFKQYQDNENEMIFAIDDVELGSMIGSISLYDINTVTYTASIGKIQIGDDRAHGKGIGRRSLVMAMKIGFRFLGLRKIVGSVHSENVQAFTNDMRVGFKIVGQCDSVVGGQENLIEITEEDAIKVNHYYLEIDLYDGKRDYDELYVGKEGKFTKTISEYDIYSFAGITGDFNPLHINIEEAKRSIFKKQVAHGMLVASLFSTVIGTIMPGKGSIYLSQNNQFLKPVFIGDTITAYVSVSQLEAEDRAVLKTDAYNQNGECVIRGMANVIIPIRKENLDE